MLNFEIDSAKSVTLNYSKTIVRPEYSRASSIRLFINPFLEGSGNMNLLPTFTEELSASFQYKNSSLSINYSKRKNPMYFTIGYEDFAEKAIFSLKNLEKESGFNINLTVNESRPYLCFYTDH